MKRKQLAALFVCSLIPYIAGNAMMAFLPVYALRLGTDDAGAGIYLSLSFATLTIGTLASGWLSDRFQRRKLTIILCGLVCVPSVFLMGQVSRVELLTLFTMIAWFAGGMVTGTVTILTGMYANSEERGRIFGVIGTTLALGQVIGGFASGMIVEHWGFSALFTCSAITWSVPIFVGLLIDDHLKTRNDEAQVKLATPIALNPAIWILILANVLASITNFSAGLVRPLIMDEFGFDAAAIASAVTISGLVMLPLPFVVGWLSDRIGRRQLIILSYVMASLGAVVLMSAFDLWQFWLSASLLALASGIIGVGFAYVTDLVPPEAVSTALARFSATPPLAGVVGFAGTGLIVQTIGLQATFMTGAVLPVLAILMMLTIRQRVQIARA